MDTIFINSKSSEKSNPHRLLLNLTDKIDLNEIDKYVALLNLTIYCTWKNIKKSYKNNKLKTSAPTWSEEFESPNDHILNQIFNTVLSTSSKSMKHLLIILQRKYM